MAGSRLFPGLSIRRRVFVSYHHSLDQGYYNEFSRVFANRYESIYDNSLRKEIDSEHADYVMRRIRESFITNTSCTILLCGAETQGRKYVDWETKATLDKEHGLIGVKLPTCATAANGNALVPQRFYDNYDSGYAVWTTWEQLTQSEGSLQRTIELANSKSAGLIRNAAPLRVRNS